MPFAAGHENRWRMRRLSCLPAAAMKSEDWKLRGDTPSFRPGAGAAAPGVSSGNTSPKLRFKKFNPNRTFQLKKVEENKFTPSHSPAQQFTATSSNSTVLQHSSAAGSAAVPFMEGNFPMNDLVQELNSMYHPPLHPLQYHLYAPIPYRLRAPMDPHQRTTEDLFIPNELRSTLQQRNEATLQTLPTSSLPEYVHVYHSLVPLDTALTPDSSRFGYPTWKYKAISNSNGRTYCLMRVQGFQLVHEHSMAAINKWNKVRSAGLVGVVEAFTTLAFGDYSLIVVYEYYPLSQTLSEVYTTPVPEGLLWAIASQLANALHAAHKKNLHARVLDMKTVIVTQKNRVRIGSCGVLDVIKAEDSLNTAESAPSSSGNILVADGGDSTPGTPKIGHGSQADGDELEAKDWHDMGIVLLTLANPKQNWKLVESKYSADLLSLLKYLIDDEPVCEQILVKLAPHMLRVLDSSLTENDNLEDCLSTELENARLVRLLAKLEFIIDRPDQENSERWAPTGDRYPIKLFKDYCFHQVDEKGRPSLDLAHALVCLNKLDAGIDENVLLISADQQVRIIMSYKELKILIEQAFRELKQ